MGYGCVGATLMGCVGATLPMRTSLGMTARTGHQANASSQDLRPDYRIALHPLQLIHPESRYVDVGIGYSVQPGEATHQTGFVELSTRAFQSRHFNLGPVIDGDWQWRVNFGMQARREYEGGLSGYGVALQSSLDLATFANTNACGLLSRGDVGLGAFLEASHARMDGTSIGSLSTGLSLRLPFMLVASFPHDPCLYKQSSK